MDELGADRMAMSDWVTKYKAWPKWARIAAPVTAGFLTIGAIGSATGNNTSNNGSTTTTVEVEGLSISEATELLLDDAKAAGLAEWQASSLIRATCTAAGETDGADTLAGKIVALDVDRTQIKPLITALGDAAEGYCPDDFAGAPDLLNDTYTAAVVLIDATTTTTEATTTTVATTTTKAPTTTRPPTTTTTKAPTTTTTVAPTCTVRVGQQNGSARPVYVKSNSYAGDGFIDTINHRSDGSETHGTLRIAIGADGSGKGDLYTSQNTTWVEVTARVPNGATCNTEIHF